MNTIDPFNPGLVTATEGMTLMGILQANGETEVIDNSINLNDLTEPGVYRVNSPGLNFPNFGTYIATSPGICRVFESNGLTTQYYSSINNEHFFRSKVDTASWYPWKAVKVPWTPYIEFTGSDVAGVGTSVLKNFSTVNNFTGLTGLDQLSGMFVAPETGLYAFDFTLATVAAAASGFIDVLGSRRTFGLDVNNYTQISGTKRLLGGAGDFLFAQVTMTSGSVRLHKGAIYKVT